MQQFSFIKKHDTSEQKCNSSTNIKDHSVISDHINYTYINITEFKSWTYRKLACVFQNQL